MTAQVVIASGSSIYIASTDNTGDTTIIDSMTEYWEYDIDAAIAWYIDFGKATWRFTMPPAPIFHPLLSAPQLISGQTHYHRRSMRCNRKGIGLRIRRDN